MTSCRLLWHDRLGQISLSVTTLFWGASAVLQFLVLKWCDHALGMTLSEGAVMQAVVSLGIAVGAVLAAARVPLVKSLSVLPMGIIMGALVMCMAFFTRADAPAGGIEIRSKSLMGRHHCQHRHDCRRHLRGVLRRADECAFTASRPCTDECRPFHCRAEL